MPVLVIAFNNHLGWSHTVNTIDAADLYELTLEGKGYRFNDEVREYQVETHTIFVKEVDGSLREEPLTVNHSLHGPVVHEEDGKALALRVAGLDTAGRLEQWWDMGRATSLAAFESALSRLQIPMFNVMYADRDGHILYLFGGRVPVRGQGDVDYWAGVIPGDSWQTLWTRTHSYEELPRVVDPDTGWLQNANDPPWTCTYPPALHAESFPPYMAPQFMHFRAQRSAELIAQDGSITFEELLEAKHSTRMLLADRLLDELIPAARARATVTSIAAAAVLDSWDRSAVAESRGAALFYRWSLEWRRRQGAFEIPWNPDDPLETPDGLADPEGAVDALEAVAQDLEEAYGSMDIGWGEVYRIRYGGRDLPATGGPGDPPGIFRVAYFEPASVKHPAIIAGDTYYAAIEFSDPVRAKVLTAYGNASQPGSPHLGDQLELFARSEMRPVWRARDEIERNLEYRERL
jgi:acyl-homoserine-lactone acylase